MGTAGNIVPLSAAVGRESVDISVLEAMLVMGENPVTSELETEVFWEFINSGVDFVFEAGALASIHLRLVYDRTGGFNGVVVPSWLVDGWAQRPGQAEMQQAFGEPIASGTGDDNAGIPTDDLSSPLVSTRTGRAAGSFTWEIYEFNSVLVHAEYDRSRHVRVLTLMAEPR